MDPISNANRIAMLLRQRLQERSKAAAAARAGRAGVGGSGDTARKGAVRSPDVVEALDDRRLRRALVEDILVDQLGSGLINDAKFQQVVDRVADAIAADADGAAVLARVMADLRAGQG